MVVVVVSTANFTRRGHTVEGSWVQAFPRRRSQRRRPQRRRPQRRGGAEARGPAATRVGGLGGAGDTHTHDGDLGGGDFGVALFDLLRRQGQEMARSGSLGKRCSEARAALLRDSAPLNWLHGLGQLQCLGDDDHHDGGGDDNRGHDHDVGGCGFYDDAGGGGDGGDDGGGGTGGSSGGASSGGSGKRAGVDAHCLLRAWLTAFDFSAADADLVTTVPGTFRAAPVAAGGGSGAGAGLASGAAVQVFRGCADAWAGGAAWGGCACGAAGCFWSTRPATGAAAASGACASRASSTKAAARPRFEALQYGQFRVEQLLRRPPPFASASSLAAPRPPRLNVGGGSDDQTCAVLSSSAASSASASHAVSSFDPASAAAVSTSVLPDPKASVLVAQQTSIGANMGPAFLARLTSRWLRAGHEAGHGAGMRGSGEHEYEEEDAFGEERSGVLAARSSGRGGRKAGGGDDAASSTAAATAAAANAFVAAEAEAAGARLVGATARLGWLSRLKVLWSSAADAAASKGGCASYFTPEAFDMMGADGQVNKKVSVQLGVSVHCLD